MKKLLSIVLGVFFILLCFMCLWHDLSLSALLSNTLVRMGMNAIMVLVMVLVMVLGSTISETLRILIPNGIILYALTKSGGGSRA